MNYPPGLPIGAGWLPAPATSTVRFPYDGTEVAAAPLGDPALATRAVDEAVAVAPAVAALPSRTRRDLLLSTRDRIAEHRAAFESLLVLETGKPLRDCRVEVARALVALTAAAEEAVRIHGETVPLDGAPSGDGLVGFWIRVPAGVVVAITGFNYPLLLAVHKIAPALAAGCPVVCKPAPQTPLASLWLLHLLREAAAAHGVPAAAAQLVTGGADVGAALTGDRRVAVVSFTGSADVGHRIARAVAPRKTVLELGANTALVVAADADLDAAADAAVRGGFYASGQACISVQRVLVVAPVAEAFLARLVKRAGEVRVGDPRDETTEVAPLIDDRATSRVDDWVRRAVAAGARAVTPTVLVDVPDGQPLWDEEVFGPVVCVRTVSDVDAAFAAVNRSRYGLHASVWTRSLDTAFKALRVLDVGGVIVNEIPGFRADTMPYGGVKDSGLGREGPRFAVEEFTVTRMAVIRP